jgi:tetratricopeptide (TPR) repeat protein
MKMNCHSKISLLVYWSISLLVYWSIGSWADGLMDLWTNRPIDPPAYAALCKAVYWERRAYQAASQGELRENYQKVREQLMSAIQIDPHSSFLYAKLAEVLIALKDFVEAEIASKESLKLNPRNADAHYSLGLLNLMRSDPRGRQVGIDELKKAVELDPEHLQAQSRLASLLYQAGEYKGASEAYSEIVKLRPYIPGLRYRLGISYMRSGEAAEAIKEFNVAVKLNRGYMEPHFHLAHLYARQSKNKEAIEECLAYLQADPGSPDMNLLLAELYVSTTEFDKAIPGAKRVLRQRGAKKVFIAEAHYRLATAYKGKGDDSLADLHFQESLRLYREILEEEQENIGIHYDVARVYDAKGDLTLAERHLRTHIRLRPDEPNAYNFLGYMFAEHDMNLEEAVALIKEAVAKEPRNGAFRDSLGWAYFKLGDLDEAIAELEKAVEFIPDDAEVREHLGEAYLRKGGKFVEKAVLEWEKALEVKQNATLQQRLEELRGSLGKE